MVAGSRFCLLSLGGTLTLWHFPSEISKQPRKHTFSYKLNIFLVIESKDLICIYYTDLIKIFMIHWREIVKYYAELEGNQKLNTKKDSFWFRPRIQYTLTLSQVSLVRCKHPQILPFNISSYTQTDFPLFQIDCKFFVRFRN